MSADGEIKARFRAIHLDSSLLELDPEQEVFFKSETGIQDTKELMKHIIQIQEDAYEVYPYPCIRGFRFAGLKISRMPAYPSVLELARNRPDAIFLDIGCCLGTEVRKVIRDGWPMSHAIATDLEAGFWDLGHKLFRTTPETYPAKFLAGDVFDDTHLSLTAPISSGPPPPVASVNALTELRGHISVIHASALFHLFDEDKQLELGKRLATLLDPRPGSIIFGTHRGLPVKGRRQESIRKMFCHSPESWTQMWEEDIFEKGQVKVNTVLRDTTMVAKRINVVPTEEGVRAYQLAWFIERL